MKKVYFFVLSSLLCTFCNAQLTGTLNIPGSFASLAAAVTALNTQGVGAGGVTLNVLAGNPQTAPAGGYVIGGAGSLVLITTSATAQVTIQGNANIVTAFTPQTAGNINDAIFKLIGADYITLTGFTMQENAGNTISANAAANNMTEFGVALFYVTTTDGAQNNTIQNNTITLDRAYRNTFGIFSTARTGSADLITAAEATASTGANNFNKFYTNNINNVNFAIALLGASVASNMDNGNDIGGTVAATGNNITNFGSNAGALSAYNSLTSDHYAIFNNHQVNDNVSFNTMISAALTSAVSEGGILKDYSAGQPSGTFTMNINNNTVTITDNPTVSSGVPVIPIHNRGINPQQLPITINITNNKVQNCVLGGSVSATSGMTCILNLSAAGIVNMTANILLNNVISASSATSAVLTGISSGSSTEGGAGSLSISNNVLRGFSSSAPAGPIQCIINSGAVTGSITINANQLGDAAIGIFTSNVASSGTFFGIINGGIGSATAALTMQNNDIRGINYNIASSSLVSLLNIQATNCFSRNLFSNIFTGLSLNTTGNVIFINDPVTIQNGGSRTFSTNSIISGFTKTLAGGTVTGILAGGSSNTATSNLNNNDFSNITVTGATDVIGIDNEDGGTVNHTITGNTIKDITAGTGTVTGIFSDFGGGNSGGSIVSSNTVRNISSAGPIKGIRIGAAALSTHNVSLNTINGLASSGAFPVQGIVSAASAGNIFRNKIYDISGTNAGSSVDGIAVTGGASNTIYNNLVGDLRTPSANAANPLVGINITNVTAGNVVNVYYNTVYLNATSSGTVFGSSDISASVVPTVNFINNIFVNKSVANTTGFTVASRRSTADLTTYGATSNSNDFYAGTPSAANLIYYDGTNADQTLAAYKARVAPRDATSISTDPNFYSTSGTSGSFLHVDALIATPLDNGGTPVSGITTDYDNQTRSATTPDIGADEFTFGVVIAVTTEYFRGSKVAGANYLNWKVTTTDPSVRLILERSADGRNFKSIQDQTATAARCAQGFNYTDDAPLAGINYYRLKTISHDGAFKYSVIVALLNKEKGFELISVAPNPVKDNAILSLTSVKGGKMTVSVSDNTGKIIMKRSLTVIVGNNPININFSALEAGTYNIKVVNADDEVKSLRFVKY